MDNFELLGTAAPGRPSAAAPLRRTPDSSLHGHVLASTPCDYPATFAGWLLQPNGELRLTVQTSNDNSGRLGNSDAGTGGSVDAFCMGVSPGPNGKSSTLSNVSLVSCGSPGALRYDEGTGRILTPQTNTLQRCLTAAQRLQRDAWFPAAELGDCAPIPCDSQQFQYNPSTGALRQKGRQCIAEWPQDLVGYRDCCIAICGR